MLKRVAMALLVLALVPAAAMADGVTFGFAGGAMGVSYANPSSPSLTTSSSVGGINPTLSFVAHIPAGASYGGLGSNFGTVSFTTAGYTSSTTYTTGAGTFGINYFGVGGNFSIVANTTFSNLTPATGASHVAAGAVLFNGAFSDITTSQFLTGIPSYPGVTPGGTGAVWFQLPTCPAHLQPSTNCSRLIASLTGTLDPGLVSFLGLSGSGASGWVAQVDIAGNGQIYNITFGDASLYVPEPGTLALFGTGLVGIAGIVRRKFAA